MPAPCKKWPNSWARTPASCRKWSPATKGMAMVSTRSLPNMLRNWRRKLADAFTCSSTSIRVDRGARIASQTCPTNANRNGSSSADGGLRVGRLAGSGQLTSDRFEHYAVVGDLSLEGRTRRAKGALSILCTISVGESCRWAPSQ